MQTLRTTHLSPCPRCHLISSTPPLLESRAEGICHLLSELCAEFPSPWGKLQVSEMPPKRLEPQPKGSCAEWPESGSSASPVAGLEGKLLKAGVQTVSSVRALGVRAGFQFLLHHFRAAFVTLGKTHNLSVSVSFSVR